MSEVERFLNSTDVILVEGLERETDRQTDRKKDK